MEPLILALDVEQVDRIEPLWRELVTHHAAVADGAWPTRTPTAAWALRREAYRSWVQASKDAGAAPTAWLLGAADAADPDGPLLGYAAVTAADGGGYTWDLGERHGELETLVVAASARGRGIGAALVAAARRALREAGVPYWSVEVLDGNAGALRMYEREGFRPFYRHLLAPTDDAGAAA